VLSLPLTIKVQRHWKNRRGSYQGSINCSNNKTIAEARLELAAAQHSSIELQPWTRAPGHRDKKHQEKKPCG